MFDRTNRVTWGAFAFATGSVIRWGCGRSAAVDVDDVAVGNFDGVSVFVRDVNFAHKIAPFWEFVHCFYCYYIKMVVFCQ